MRISSWTFAVLIVLASRPVWAQAPPPPPPPEAGFEWTGMVNTSINLTKGNTDTVNYSLSLWAERWYSDRNVCKTSGLYLRGRQDDQLNVSRTSLWLRSETTVSPHTFVFVQVDSLRDTFKAIDYLIMPGAGVGYKLVDTERTKYAIDTGLGAVSEKNPGTRVRHSGAVTAGDKLERTLTEKTVLKHELTALWKAEDLADALYTLSASLNAGLSNRLQLSVSVLSVYKNKPPTSATKKNDVTLMTGLSVTF